MFFFVFESEEDEAKFTYIYEKHKRLLLHKAYSILHDGMLAEDAVSEAFIRIFKNIHKIEDPTSNRTTAFVVTIVKNTALTLLQKDKAKESELLDDVYQDNINIEEQVLNNMAAEQVYVLLEQMGEELKSVFVLKFAYGLAHKEIGEMLGLTENNVTVKLHRAKRKLNQLLEKEGLLHD